MTVEPAWAVPEMRGVVSFVFLEGVLMIGGAGGGWGVAEASFDD